LAGLSVKAILLFASVLPKDMAISALARESAQIKGAGGLRTIEMMVSGYLRQLLAGREQG
jgi:hypothetical protein